MEYRAGKSVAVVRQGIVVRPSPVRPTFVIARGVVGVVALESARAKQVEILLFYLGVANDCPMLIQWEVALVKSVGNSAAPIGA